MFLAIATIGSLVVFVGLLSYTARVRSQVGEPISVLKLKKDVPAFQSITEDEVERTHVPAKYVSPGMVRDFTKVATLVTRSQLSKDSYLTFDMLREPSNINKGERELAILIDAETGVAGEVEEGDYVDIYATYGDAQGDSAPTSARIIVPYARVISIGQLVKETKNQDGSFSSQQLVPVTFALNLHDSLVLADAESFAVKVRLALRAPGDDSSPSESSVLVSASGHVS